MGIEIAREVAWILLGFVLANILFQILRSSWLFWRRARYKASMKWVFLELRIPREIPRGPRAMEQLLVVLRSLRNAPDTIKEIYFDGEVTDWFSLEMVSIGGQTHFYIRVPLKMRHIVEATVFSYYPEVEVHEADDYMMNFPGNMDELETQGYNLWGTEVELAKHPAYPIRTYVGLEIKEGAGQDTKEAIGFDPMSPFLEIFAKIKPEEMIGMQIILAPKAADWNKEYEKVLGELQAGKKKKEGGSGVKTKMQFPEGSILPTFTTEEATKKEEGPAPAKSAGEAEAIKAVENNLSKPAFDVLIRLIYLSPKSIFHVGLPFAGLRGAFSQFNTMNMNGFKFNKYTLALGVTGKELWLRKARILYAYQKREIPISSGAEKWYTSFFPNTNKSKWMVLNTESIATLFHPPTNKVLTAPHIERLESKKVGPPAGLAIFAGDEETLPFE